LDPAFTITESNLFGSDPNRLPDIDIKGKTSIIGLTEEFKTDPNQPLFILDGFESTLQAISDLSTDRVQSITILKDAAATAIYGSKAANGVIVVETKMPEQGKLKFSYNGNFIVGWADLSDYNLMNASEKLEFEKLSGYYGKITSDGQFLNEVEASKYYMRKAEIERGVNTYWLNKGIRAAFKQSHNVYIDGGDNSFRYGVGFNIGNNQGVMKGSDRENINGNIRLIYRTGNWNIANNLNINYSKADREKVPFSAFAQANPYHRIYDAEGDIVKIMEEFVNEDFNSSSYGSKQYVVNPLYNMGLSSFNTSSSIGFTNNTDIDYSILQELRAKARFSISKNQNKTRVFKSPNHTDFLETDRLLKGSYNWTDGSTLTYDGDFNLTYGKLLAEKHMVNAVGGLRLSENYYLSSGYSVRGFIDDNFNNPSFSYGYPEGAKPPYSENVKRSASYYINAGYSYDNRYMMDLNLRSDGSSIFGAKNMFTTTWAVGLSWNIHNEKWFRNSDIISLLKIRGSIGNPGNQNFDADIALNTYMYNTNLQNLFGLSSTINAFGNKDLSWQKTIDRNIGIDLSFINNRYSITFDLYSKITDPLLIYISLPSSTGTSSIPKNFGSQTTKGFTLSANARIIQTKDITWSVNLNARRNRSKYNNIGNSLQEYNKNNQSRNLIRYFDGASATSLWSVRSLGIDPANGREVFLKKDGTQTYLYDYEDEVIVGDSSPNIDGVIGTNFRWKGLTASVYFRYKLGGSVFMTALYNKVENISETSLKYNQDKRAFYDRWISPGDRAKYRAISLTTPTPISSRFLVEENLLSGESISVGYESTGKWLNKIGAESLTFRAYMNEIFRISSIKNERGIDYPFERSVSFSIGVRF
jgi:TonB-linked outer membrane protein, SusC/RagA family/TonB-dependent outer membrane receptor, SusC/RagA subfamily, signature region